MCGIAGFIDFKKKLNNGNQIITDITDAISHRGPDDSGYSFIETDDYNIGLGHRRLSIIDTSSNGHQPMKSNCGNYEIVFNGEIYNFQELKKDLEQFDINFISNSDTEVVLYWMKHFGIDGLEKLKGMFAFSFYDKTNHMIYITRDRLGVKPLVYFQDDDTLCFSSEIKSFVKYPNFSKNIDKQSVYMFMQLGYIPAPFTIFENTQKLSPGHYLKIDILNNKIEKVKYWDILNIKKKNTEYSYDELKSKIIKSVSYRMISDVPVGSFLSAGVDSTLTATIIKKVLNKELQTFTLGYNESEFSEADEAKIIASELKTIHRELIALEEDAKKIIPKLPFVFDEPFGDKSAIPTMILSDFTSKYVKVALSSDGGDELFGGYENRYIYNYNLYKKLNKIPYFIRILLASTVKSIPTSIIQFFADKYFGKKVNYINEKLKKAGSILKFNSIEDFHLRTLLRYSEDELNSLFNDSISNNIFNKTAFKNFDTSNKVHDQTMLMMIDIKTYLVDDVLTKVDKATMYHSLEGREPLLDHELVEYAINMPIENKIKGKTTKIALKDVLKELFDVNLISKRKKGFSVPLDKWLKGDLKYLLDNYLSKEKLDKHSLFNTNYVLSLKDAFLNEKQIDVYKIWYILVFQMWYEEWIG